jgi:hypothetical protein
MLFETLVHKKIYLSPYNDLTVNLSKNLSKVEGFIDNSKIGDNIFKPSEINNYDYIIINSRYWYEISQQFDLDKVILSNNKDNKLDLILYKDYINTLINPEIVNKFDIVFFAYNKSNVLDASLVIRELKIYNYNSAIVVTDYGDQRNANEGLLENQDISTIHISLLKFINFKALICSVDWIDRDLIKFLHQKGIYTIGLVDGIEDFEDTDYSYNRYAYQTVEFVLACGKNDATFLSYKKDKCAIVGLPKMYDMWHTEVKFPQKILVMINVNFTYGTFEEKRDFWLNEVIDACKILNLDYIISQHHADKGDLSNFNLSSDNVYETIKRSSIVISRFSTVISESLALGKPVVYHNPHNEKVKLYKNPENAFSISYDTNSLVEKMKFEIDRIFNVRERATIFLDNQFNIMSHEQPAVMAAKKINKIIMDGKLD